MRHAHAVAQVRAVEEPLLAAGAPLMARASTGLATEVARRLPSVYGARVVLLVGKGNNGADALYAGAWLARRGAAVVALLVGEPVGHAFEDFLRAGGRTGSPDALAGADAVLDGLVGIGGSGPLRAEAAGLAAQVRDGLVVAVDVPSGVDADTGAVTPGAVVADVTVTFGTLKPGLLLARRHVGDLVLVDIGLPLPEADVQALTDEDVAALLPQPGAGDDKYTRGVVGVLAGSAEYAGAAVLAVGGAVLSGAGMVRYIGHARGLVRTQWPEAVAAEGRVQSWVVGPGAGTDAGDAVAEALRQDVPAVVDADGLTLTARHPDLLRRDAATVLTPHDREFERFGEPVGPDRLAAARGLAARLGVHVLLKGDATVVAAPDGRARINTTGTPYLATAGSGDVLAGAIGALLAQGLDPLDAASVAAHVHGLAGQEARSSASRLLEVWPSVLARLRDWRA